MSNGSFSDFIKMFESRLNANEPLKSTLRYNFGKSLRKRAIKLEVQSWFVNDLP